MRESVKSRRARSVPPAPMGPRARGVGEQRGHGRGEAAGSSGGTSTPVTPCSTTSTCPGTRVATTGRPHAMASSSASGRPSRRDAET